ncbi:DUF4136 domain-containing protein [bacterium]|nr:DUF4136 domain-containing protein [bacterium]MBU1994043.1 DUF4136 domain-containing protein [bacterium]
MKFLYSLVLLTLVFAGCSTLKVQTDFDPSYSFEAKKSFAIIKSNKQGIDSLDEKRIDKAIIQELKLKSYALGEEKDASLHVMYRINVKNKTQVYTDYQIGGFFPYRGVGMGVATSKSYDYEEGKLVIDVMDAKTKSLVWQSVSTDRLKEFDSPQRRMEYINGVVKEAMKKFPHAK